ncbi:MAG: hypothetical protein K0R93_579 [Anaerosolibacter sp.]|jgi:tetratricopeptide (TPR) repeat protein|uniref:O-antigen ligase family protein n=1 Tax=Anaerosolibacter sp. TaxID=1872527 RepID=UPI00261BE339|nr:O-antigen ligase family protein [Anaerosolibacter sp.]MDF2545681.1 hypothetical protein [Anaerosolibacter sp.]
MTTKTKKKIEDLYSILSPGQYLIFISLCILLFYPPFFRGLFFQKELLITHILTFSLFTIWMITKFKSSTFQLIDSITDVLALGVLFMYGISIFYGVNTRLAIAEFLKYANYIAIFFMVKKFSMEYPQTKIRILNVLLLSGAVVAIIGVGSAIGTFSYKGAFVGGRINSTFQYPNALAAYLFALFILALGLLQTSKSDKEKYFYGSLANLYFFTYIPTFSRGMWLMSPIIYFIYLIVLPKGNKLKMLYYSIITALPALLLSILFIRGIASSSSFVQWLILIGSMGLTAVLIYGSGKLNLSFEKISYKKMMTAGIVLIVALATIGTIVLNTIQPLVLSNMDSQVDTSKILTREIQNVLKNKEYRLEVNAIIKNLQSKDYAGKIDIYSINDKGEAEALTTQNVIKSEKVILPFATLDTTQSIRVRFLNRYTETEAVFDEAAIYDATTGEKVKDLKLSYKFIPESIIGRINSITAGENSMEARFSFYKDAFKILKDYPLFGAGGGAWATLYFKYQSYMYWSTQAHNFFLQLLLEIGTIGMLIFLAFLGTIGYHLFKNIRKTEDSTLQTNFLSIAMGSLAILVHSVMDFDLSLGAMSILLWSLLAMLPQDKAFKGKKAFQPKLYSYVAVALTVIFTLGSFSLNMAQGFARDGVVAVNQSDGPAAISYFEKAKKFDPFSAAYPLDLATIYRMTEKNETFFAKIQELIEEASHLEPYSAKILEKSAELSFNTGDYLKGLDYLDQMTSVQPMNVDNYLYKSESYLKVINRMIEDQNYQELESIVRRVPNIKNQLEITAKNSLQPLKASSQLVQSSQKLGYVVEHQKNPEKLGRVNDVELYNRFQLDIDRNHIPDNSWVTNSEKGKAEIQQYKEYISFINGGADYGMLWVDNVTIQSNEKHVLEIEYTSTLKDENLDLYVYDYSSGKEQLIARLDNLKQSSEFTTQKFEFIAPDGMAGEKQRIGIVHRGNDHGVVNIRLMSLMRVVE